MLCAMTRFCHYTKVTERAQVYLRAVCQVLYNGSATYYMPHAVLAIEDTEIKRTFHSCLHGDCILDCEQMKEMYALMCIAVQ